MIGNTYPIGRQWFSWIERDGQPLFVQAPTGLGHYERECSEHGHVRTWSFEHTPAVTLENDLPVTYKPFPEISLTTFSGWADVVGLFLQPWSVEPGRRGDLEQELDALRTRYASNQTDGIAAAIDLVRHNVRYLGYSPGVFALVPADPVEVWQRRFGDCKEKSRLLCWLLRELGVEADPVLVNTIGGAALTEMPASPGAFDHVVVRLRHGGTELWIDPTDVARRGNVMNWKSLPFHFGLPLAHGSDQLVAIPPEPAGTSGLEVEEIVRVDSKTRGGTITVIHAYRHGAADQLRHAMDSRGRSAVSTYLTEQVKQTHPDVTSTCEMEVEDDPLANRLVLRCHFRSEELLKNSPDGQADLFFLIPYSIPPNITGTAVTRKHPLAIQHPVDVKHTIRLNPEDTKKLNIPKHAVRSEFFDFSFSTSTSKSESIHTFSLQSSAGAVPVDKIRKYSNDLNLVSEALNWHIRFSRRDQKFSRVRRWNSPNSW